MNSLWIQYLFHEFTMNALSVSRMQVNLHFSRVFAVCYVNSYSIILNQLSIWLIHMKSSFRGCTLNSKSGSHIHLESTNRFSESLWIHYLLRGLSGNSLSLREITMNSLFTICFANWLWINYLFRVFAINSLSLTNSLLVSRNHVQYTIFFAHYFTMNPLSYSPKSECQKKWMRVLNSECIANSQ